MYRGHLQKKKNEETKEELIKAHLKSTNYRSCGNSFAVLKIFDIY